MKKYVVQLTDDEYLYLQKLVTASRSSARKLTRARVLLKADTAHGQQAWTDARISEAFDVSISTVARIRKTYCEGGLKPALQCEPRRTYRRKLSAEQEAQILELAQRNPPQGHHVWTLRLLAEKAMELGYVSKISHETIRRLLKDVS